MLIRIITERKNVKWLYQLIGQCFAGFTIYNTAGFCKGIREKSIVFEIDIDQLPKYQACSIQLRIDKICKVICGHNKQDCVLVQKIECGSLMY